MRAGPGGLSAVGGQPWYDVGDGPVRPDGWNMTGEGQAAEATAAEHFTILTPADWYRIPLRPVERRGASVRALVDRQFHGVDDQPILKRRTLEDLRGAAEEAANKGGLVLYLSTQELMGVPLPASLLVTLVPTGGDALSMARALADEGEVGLRDLPAGRAVRSRVTERFKDTRRMGSVFKDTLLQYYIPLPGEPEMLLLSFGSPLEPLAEAMTELFDAIAGSVRWPEEDGGRRG